MTCEKIVKIQMFIVNIDEKFARKLSFYVCYLTNMIIMQNLTIDP